MDDAKKLTDKIAKDENEADKKAFDKVTIEPIKRGLSAIKDTIMGTPAQNKKAADERRAKNAANPNSFNAKLDETVGMGGYKKGGKVKTKKYETGGLTFSDMPEEDRAAQAKSAIESINAREAAKSEAAGGMKAAAPRRTASPVKAGSIRENLRDMDMAGVDTGYDATEAKRNLSRAGTRHAVGKMNLADRGYGATETKRNLNRAVSGMKKGGSVSSASKRADGCITKGKTKGRMI